MLHHSSKFTSSLPLGQRPLLPFAQVRESVRQDDEGKWDQTVSRRELMLRQGQLVLPPEADSLQGEERQAALSPLAQSQLCARLGIPVAYYRVLPDALQDQNVNYWLKEGSAKQNPAKQGGPRKETDCKRETDRKRNTERWRVRAQFGAARAILSDAYSPLDNGPLCDTLAQLLSPQHRVNWFGLDDEGFHLHIVDPSRAREVLPGDDYFCGVYVGNSEVGCRSVQVEAYLMRLVCTNGLVAVIGGQSLLRRRHIHIEASRFQNALNQAFAHALEVADGFIETLRRTTTQTIPDPQTTIERLGQRFGLAETTQHAALAAMAREHPHVQETTYGLLQGLTEAAQLLPDGSRHDLETLAGHLAQSGVPKWALRREEMSGSDGFKPRQTRELEAVV